MDIEPILNLTKVALEDVQSQLKIEGDPLARYIDEVVKNEALLGLLQLRNDNFDWTKETPLGGAGTSLNAIVLYSLIRQYNMNYVIETGISGGYYSTFMLEALHANYQFPILTSLELSDDMTKVGKLVPASTKKKTIPNSAHDEVEWNLHTGRSSLEYFQKVRDAKQKHCADIYCHDSLHTLSHMMKELNEFKQTISEDFFIFIDDEKSEGFWDKCIQMGAFKKPKFEVLAISGKESRLNGHLGGFIKYRKL